MPIKKIGRAIHGRYHWIVAGIAFLMVFAYGGTVNNLASLHIVPVSNYLGITRADFAFFSSLRTFVGMFSTFLSGFFISRFGIRRCSGFGMLAGALGCFVLTQLKNVAMLSLGNALLGISAGFCSTSAAVYIARVWFYRHSGTVLGTITAATGAGASLICMLQTAAMEAGGFRSSYGICAAIMGVAGLLVLVFVRNRPQEIGLVPLGEGEESPRSREGKEHTGYIGYTMKALLKRPSFYLMMLCIAFAALAIYSAFSVIRPFVADCGYSATQASGVQSFMMLLLTGTKILTGYLNDRIGAQKVFVSCLLCAVVGLGILALTNNYVLIITAVFIFTCGIPLCTLAAPLLATALFGYRAQAQYTGIILSTITVMDFVAEYVTNMFYDYYGSYHFSFFMGAICALISAVFLFAASKKEKAAC